MKEDIISIDSCSIMKQQGVARSESRFWLLLLGILLLAAILRLYALDTYPQRFNQDEMLLGYDAWNIWNIGHDHHGVLFPIFFRSFNDYVPPVANYIAAPFVGILGLSEESTRLPFALMGIATVFFVALLGCEWFNSATGLLAAFLLALEPWHVNYSRIAFPASCIPFFTVVSLYFFTRGTSLSAIKVQRRSITLLWLAGSAFSFALLTGSDSTMKVDAPLLLCACAVAIAPLIRNKLSRLRWTDLFIWLALYALFVCPLALAQLQNWNHIQVRFNNMSVFNAENWFMLFLAQYINAYNFYLLFFLGYIGGVSVRPQGVGDLFWLEGLLFIFAFIGLLQNKRVSRQIGFALPILLFIWLIAFPIASSLTAPSPHELRTYNFLPLPEILAGYGAVVAWDIVGRYRWLCLSIAMGVLVVFNGIFLSYFFASPLLLTDATAEQIPYNVGLRPAMTIVMRQIKPCDTVWLEPGTDAIGNQTYMYFLFLTRYPPSKFQNTKHELGTQWYDLYDSIGQVHFAIPDTNDSTGSLPAGCRGKPSRTFFITRTVQVGPGWQQVFAVKNHAGIPIWQALVIGASH